MGVTPQGQSITIGFDCQFDVRLKDCTIASILAAYAELLPQLLADFFQKVLIGYGEHAMALKRKPFAGGCCVLITAFF